MGQFSLFQDQRSEKDIHEQKSSLLSDSLAKIYQLLEDAGFGQLLICTPAEFLGGDDDEESDS